MSQSQSQSQQHQQHQQHHGMKRKRHGLLDEVPVAPGLSLDDLLTPDKKRFGVPARDDGSEGTHTQEVQQPVDLSHEMQAAAPAATLSPYASDPTFSLINEKMTAVFEAMSSHYSQLGHSLEQTMLGFEQVMWNTVQDAFHKIELQVERVMQLRRENDRLEGELAGMRLRYADVCRRLTNEFSSLAEQYE